MLRGESLDPIASFNCGGIVRVLCDDRARLYSSVWGRNPTTSESVLNHSESWIAYKGHGLGVTAKLDVVQCPSSTVAVPANDRHVSPIYFAVTNHIVYHYTNRFSSCQSFLPVPSTNGVANHNIGLNRSRNTVQNTQLRSPISHELR